MIALVVAVAASVAVAAWRQGAAARRWAALRAWADAAGWRVRASPAEVRWLPPVTLPLAVVEGRHGPRQVAVVWSAGDGAATTVYVRVADDGVALASYRRWLEPGEIEDAVARTIG